MMQKVLDGFIILLPASGALQAFGEALKLSHIEYAPQENFLPRLILNMSVKPNARVPRVNDTMDREVTPESI